MDWRVGIHLDDVLIDGEDFLGDGINIAACLGPLSHRHGLMGILMRPPTRRSVGAAVALLLSAVLAACESTRSFEKTADGSIVYLDELSPALKVQAREAV